MTPAQHLLAQARAVWPEGERVDRMPTILAVIVGDYARAIRDLPLDFNRQAKRELGNLVLTALRYADDLGLHVDDCVEDALEAQERWRRENGIDTPPTNPPTEGAS